MQLPLVSIIVPIHNSEKTLKRCVDSILKQDYRELEVFLVTEVKTGVWQYAVSTQSRTPGSK